MTSETQNNERVGLSDTYSARRYFQKFEGIMGHLGRVAGVMEAEGSVTRREVDILTRHLSALTFSFRALSMKYLMTGRDTGRFFGSLTIDNTESGFPTTQEMMVMANDAQQAHRHLASLPSVTVIKRDMLAKIIGDLSIPTKLQFAMSQRLYYQELERGNLFWARNDPQAVWVEDVGDKRRRYMIHWSVYDSQMNLPVIYLMDLEDTDPTPLPRDERRWPEVQAHLMAQSIGGLKLLTIAKGFDEDFDELHPKRLRRFLVGPMYSHKYTRQSGPIRDVLAQASAPKGEDWALAWTEEDLHSESVRTERAGWFGTNEREIFALDPLSEGGADSGTTRQSRALILPERPYQVLAEQNPPGFAGIRKFVVSPGGRVLSYR